MQCLCLTFHGFIKQTVTMIFKHSPHYQALWCKTYWMTGSIPLNPICEGVIMLVQVMQIMWKTSSIALWHQMIWCASMVAFSWHPSTLFSSTANSKHIDCNFAGSLPLALSLGNKLFAFIYILMRYWASRDTVGGTQWWTRLWSTLLVTLPLQQYRMVDSIVFPSILE